MAELRWVPVERRKGYTRPVDARFDYWRLVLRRLISRSCIQESFRSGLDEKRLHGNLLAAVTSAVRLNEHLVDKAIDKGLDVISKS